MFKKSRTRRTRASLVLGTLFASLGFLAVAVPANAEPSCASGYFCVWTGTDYHGSTAHWTGNSSNWPDSVDDNVESLYQNGNNCGLNIYQLTNYSGYSKYIPKNYWKGNIGEWTMSGSKTWANRPSSHKWC